jgi:hypothetical protein
MKAAHIKAVPVNGLVQFVEKELNSEQLKSIREQLGADAKWFNGHVLAQDLVPIGPVNRFTELAAAAKGEPVKNFARRAGRFGAELGLKSVYKFIIAVMSIDYVLRKAPFMWSRVYDGGNVDVDAGSNRARIRVTEFPSNEAICARITGWFEVIGERAGAKDMRCIHTACAAEGAPECVWDFVWR